MSVMQNSKSPTEIIVISDSDEDSPENIIVISDDIKDSNQDGNTPDDPKPPQEEESSGAMGNNPVQDGPTSPTEYKDRRASSGLLRSKRPMSTPIRHSFDPIRIVYRPGYFTVHPPPRLQVDQNFQTQKIVADPKMRCHQKSFGIWRVTEAILGQKTCFFSKNIFWKKFIINHTIFLNFRYAFFRY